MLSIQSPSQMLLPQWNQAAIVFMGRKTFRLQLGVTGFQKLWWITFLLLMIHLQNLFNRAAMFSGTNQKFPMIWGLNGRIDQTTYSIICELSKEPSTPSGKIQSEAKS